MVTKRTCKNIEDSQRKDSLKTQFEDVYFDSYDCLKAVIAKYVKCPEDVEDIVQETFVRTYEAKRKTRILKLKAYFFTTARNLSLKHQSLHANKITGYLEDLGISEVYDDKPSVEAEVQAHEQFSIFCEAVRELPLQCRRVFILKKIYDLSHEEIADRLGITVSTTNQHLAKGIARCTLYMREKGYLEEPHHNYEGKKSGDNA